MREDRDVPASPPPSRRRHGRLATLAALVLAAAVIAVAAGRGVADAPERVGAAALVLGVGAPACVGLLLLLRRPGTRVAWILLAGALSVATVMAALGVGGLALDDDPDSAPGAWALVSRQRVGGAVPVAARARLRLPRRPAAVAALAARRRARPRVRRGGAAAAAAAADARGPDGEVDNPIGIGAGLDVADAGVLGLLVRAAALAVRRRAGAARALPRRQPRRAARSCGSPTARCCRRCGSAGPRSRSLIFGVVRHADLAVLMLVHAWLAVAVAVAVTRHGLYEIDRLFNRTLVYAVLTALLAGTYALVALLAGQVAGGSAFAASVGTLAAALAFRPLRDRLQSAVDRRFARQRFEGVRLLRAFLDDVRDGRSEPEDVGAAVAARARRPGRRGRLPPARDRRLRGSPRPPARGAARGRARALADRARRPRGRACCSTTRRSRSGPTCSGPCSTPRPSRSSSPACASSCACSSPRSSPRGCGSRRPATRSAGGSSATSTTARSSGSSRSASCCGGCSARCPARRRSSGPRSMPPSTRSPRRSPTCARSRPASARRASTRA